MKGCNEHPFFYVEYQMKNLFVLLIILFAGTTIKPQGTTFYKIMSLSDTSDEGRCVRPTFDGGYIL
jgi:hypothetical protein